jgi:hypothetical protein
MVRLAQQFAILRVLLERRFHLTAERLVSAAGVLQESVPDRGFALQSRVEDVLDLPPTFGRHDPRQYTTRLSLISARQQAPLSRPAAPTNRHRSDPRPPE